MNTISLKRIKLLLLADWYELKEYLMLGVLACTGVVLAIMLFDQDFKLNDVNLTTLLSFMLLATFFLSVNFINYRANSTKGLGLLTPAKPIEKFLTLFIVMLLLFVLCFLIYFITTITHSLIRTGTINENIYQPIYPLFNDFQMPLFFILTLASIYILLMFTFKGRYAPLMSVLSIVGIIFVLMKIDFLNITYFMGFRGYAANDIGLVYHDGFYPGILSILLFSPYIFGAALVVLFYVSYLKLKEKEQR